MLPFENLSGEAEQEFFSDGLTEEMITALGRVNPQRLGVIARTSAMRYKGRARSIDQVARELGVSYVLEGSVRRGGDRVRVTAQLVQASDQSNVWSDAFDRGLGDMLALQSELASSIAHAIRIRLSPAEEKRIASRRPIAPDAYELYLKGRYLWNTRTRDGLSEAARCFEEGVITDPRDADVGAILGWGFAPYTGGPISMIDTMGTKAFLLQCETLAAKYGKRFAPNKLLREMAAGGETFYGRFGAKTAA